MPEDSADVFPKWDYQEYPKTLPRDDFWGQGRRTILGRRITEEEVTQLVNHIRHQLALSPRDVLLEVGSGNGALSVRLFDDCAGYVGGDLSAYLIDVAKEFFERAPAYRFVHGDAVSFLSAVEQPDRFTKGLCFAVLQYLDPATVEAVLHIVTERFSNLRRLLLGNLPNREKAHLFFQEGFTEADLATHESQIGRWWSRDEVAALAGRFGWEVSFTQMSASFFNAAYRFDAVLTRADARE